MAAAWRGLLHVGLIVLFLVPVLAFARWSELLRADTGRFKPAKFAYLGALVLSAIVILVLAGLAGGGDARMLPGLCLRPRAAGAPRKRDIRTMPGGFRHTAQ
jgi:hypothetical protein